MTEENNHRDLIARLEERIEKGDFVGGDFHLFVQKEIYPLLIEEKITLDEFTRLVKKYSEKYYPHKNFA